MKKKLNPAVFIVPVLIAVIAAFVVFDAVSDDEISETDFAMGAVVSQKITGKNPEETAEKIISEIENLENKISWRISDSEIAQLNENKKSNVSQDTQKILLSVLDVCKKSGGAVDLTVGKLTRLWNIGEESFKLPSDDEIASALSGISWEAVEIENGVAKIAENQSIDLGFVGKGAACDKAMEILKADGAKAAVISVGGSLCLYGEDSFKVGVRNPLGDVSDYMAVLTLGDGFVSTSGNYERFSEYGGKKYHHILSTETGFPVENDLLSVTVVCSSGILSDALSTACYCLGFEKSITLLDEYDASAVFIFDDNTVKVTDGLKEKIKITNDEFKLWNES